MGYFTLGELIGEARRQLGITQEELAYGICSPGTISKIENGCAIPKRHNYEALMQRLGKAPNLFQPHATQGDIEMLEWMQKVHRAVKHQRIEEAATLLANQKEVMEHMGVLYRQYYLYMNAIVHSCMEREPAEVLKELEQALSLTGLTVENYLKLRRLFTSDEIIILNNMAIQYQRQKDYKAACRIWDRMEEYLERRQMDEAEKEKLYPLILFNYGNLLYEMRIYEEAIELCEKGITYCRLSSCYVMLPYLLYCKAVCMQSKGEAKTAEEISVQVQHLLHVLTPTGELNCKPVNLTL